MFLDPNTREPITNPRVISLLTVYREALDEHIAKSRPAYYAGFGSAALFAMGIAAILDDSFSKHTEAWKTTCARLGIAHTYPAISAYMKGV